jgi:hypothetical protein
VRPVRTRRGPHVVPMWPGPHGDHTGYPPECHRDRVRTRYVQSAEVLRLRQLVGREGGLWADTVNLPRAKRRARWS